MDEPILRTPSLLDYKGMSCRMQHRVLLNMKLVANSRHGVLLNIPNCNHYQSTYTSYYSGIIWFIDVVESGGPKYITRLCLDNIGMNLFGYNVTLNNSVLGAANVKMLPINTQHVAKLVCWGQFSHNPIKNFVSHSITLMPTLFCTLEQSKEAQSCYRQRTHTCALLSISIKINQDNFGAKENAKE